MTVSSSSFGGRCGIMRRRNTVLIGLMSIIGLVLMQSPASAGHGDISLPITTFIQADEGEIVPLVSEQVDAELVGATCSWDFHAINQESAHPGNDLILSTNGTDTVVPGVEDVPDQILDVAGTFELGETVAVSLRMGPDGYFSARLSVEVVCDEEVAPTTTIAAPATTAAPAAPTTAAPAAPTTAPVETEVGGQVETPPPAAPALAVTGPSSSTGILVGFAVLLLLGGIGALGVGTRARD